MDSTQVNFHHQETHPSQFGFALNKFRREQFVGQSCPQVVMNPNGMSTPAEPMPMAAGMWSASSTQSQTRPRPATIHETGYSYCMPGEYTPMPAWDSSTMPLQPTHANMQQTYSVHQDGYYNSQNMSQNGWTPKSCDDSMDIQRIDSEMTLGQAYTTDEHVPILDLRYSTPNMENDGIGMDASYNSRRMSGSSFTMSTTGALSEMPSYEDFSATLSEAPSFSSDYPPPSNRTSLMSSTQLSPVASPRMTPQNRSELVRTQSRGRASPSPRPTMRSAPYSIERGPNKRWSTGSYAPAANRRPSPFIYNPPPTFDPMGARMSDPLGARMPERQSSPTLPHNPMALNMANLQHQQQNPYMMPTNPTFNRHSMMIPSHGYHDQPQFQTPPPLLSHGLFRMLQSNADPHALHGHYTDLSDPPDLYASLHEEQLSPPESDMNPSDPDLVPHEQELRFEGDLYTPRWVRGHGNKREGWCGICKPGRWLVLKNSAFWYDKSFTHGISAATGSAFQEPVETRRMDGNPDVWEGLCGSCGEWVALVSSKKKGTTWFRHAYKCHTHPKIKDAPKRRRESSHARAAQSSSTPKPKLEQPATPHVTSCLSNCGSNTATNVLPVVKTEVSTSVGFGTMI